MKRFAAMLAVVGLMAAVPATVNAKPSKPKCGGQHELHIGFANIPFPLC
jgi:hypothetical protein